MEIPKDMQCNEIKDKLEDKGIKCENVVSIRDLLILLSKSTEETCDK